MADQLVAGSIYLGLLAPTAALSVEPDAVVAPAFHAPHRGEALQCIGIPAHFRVEESQDPREDVVRLAIVELVFHSFERNQNAPAFQA